MANVAEDGIVRGKVRHSMLLDLFADNSDAQNLVRSLSGLTEPVLGYASPADKRLQNDIQSELEARLAQAVDDETLVEIGLSHFSDQTWESTSGEARLDVPKILKARKQVEIWAPVSITRVIVVPVPAGPDHGHIYAPTLATLNFKSLNTPESPQRSRSRDRRSSAMPVGARPTFEDLTVSNPTVAETVQIVRKFINADGRARKKAAEFARQSGAVNWNKSRAARELGVFQMMTLLPAEKAFFGFGEGREMLSHALIRPLQRAKRTKLNKSAMTRDQVLNLHWASAFNNSAIRNKPPFVKL